MKNKVWIFSISKVFWNMISGIISKLKLIMLQCSKPILTWKVFENDLNEKYLRVWYEKEDGQI